jgi:NAD(P)-dependent dehydrogenase (short-subunit alcohol dehydrogenase family)
LQRTAVRASRLILGACPAAEALAAEITSAAAGRSRSAPTCAALRPGELVQAVAEALSPVDVLVSNAGLSHVQPLEDITATQFDEMLAVNLRAPFLLAPARGARHAGTGVRPRTKPPGCTGEPRYGGRPTTGSATSRRRAA